jgi:hypothetical protein
MANFSATPSSATISATDDRLKDLELLDQLSPGELAQALLAKLAIGEKDWHRLKSNRNARATEQTAAALVFLLKGQSEEALPRLQQAIGWLDRSISAPPCPSHGDRRPTE